MFGAVFDAARSVTKAVDPTGLTTKVVDTTETVADVATGAAGMAVDAATEVVTDPVGSASAVVDAAVAIPSSGLRLATSAVSSTTMVINGAMVELSDQSAVDLLYNAIVPKTAQAVLRGELPSKDDFTDDAVAWVGGPVQGIYVAANSPSAKIISQGGTPTADQLGRDMVSALTPVALAKFGL